MMKEIQSLVGKTVMAVEYNNGGEYGDSIITLTFDDGTAAEITASGWSEGVSAEGTDLFIQYKQGDKT